MTASFSADDYAGALRALMPRGRVWSFEPGSVQDQVIRSLVPVAERVDGAAIGLLTDAVPATTTALLPEWEETLGLPDACLGANPTMQQRRSQAAARFAAGGGQSRGFLIRYAATLGFRITITEGATFRAGRSRAGAALGTATSFVTWWVTVLLDDDGAGRSAFRVGRSRAGERLASTGGRTALECELRRVAPAHTLIRFTA